MKRIQAFWHKQATLILSRQPAAILYAVALSLLPYTNWLSVVIIALITLRKGWREGIVVLVPAVMAHWGCSLATLPMLVALLNTLILFLPCYVAACVLRLTTSWQGVAAFFFLCLCLVALLVQAFLPELIFTQYQYVIEVVKLSNKHSAMSEMLEQATHIDQQVIASFIFGVQLVSVVFSACLSLVMARSMQSRLFNPGGFRQEVLTFRVVKLGLIVGLIMTLSAVKHNVIALMLLPTIVLYFLLAGLSLSANALMRKNTRLVFVLLITPLFVMPFVMVPLYGTLGLLDGLFNLRQLNRKKEEVK